LTSRTVTLLGSRVTMIAALYQVAQLTGSPLMVGLLGAAELVPTVAFSLFGGLLADRVDRRSLAVRCELLLAVTVAVLVANAVIDRPLVWLIFLCSSIVAGLAVLQRPSLDAALPLTVSHDQLAAAAVLMSVSINVASIAGPAIGGLFLAGAGPAVAYGVDVATFVVSGVLLWAMTPFVVTRAESRATVVGGIVDGLRYAWRRPALRGSYLVDLAAMAFAFPYALLPFLADGLGADWAVGLMFSAGAVGGLLATATSGWTGRVVHHGRAILLSAAVWGGAIGLLGLVSSVLAALACLVIAGAADTLSGVFRDTLWNATIADGYRGRLAGVEVLSYAAGPPIGQARGGATAGAVGVAASFWSGGLMCLGSLGFIALTHRRLLNYDVRTDEDAVANRASSQTRQRVQGDGLRLAQPDAS
jgi:hypothetical protein